MRVSQGNTSSSRGTSASGNNGQRILYDARGVRVKTRKKLSGFPRILLFYILPYLVINGLIFLFVTSTPEISSKVGDTNDYKTTEVEFTIKSLLPLKSVTADLESTPVEIEKSGNTYTVTANQNGTLMITAVAINGMQSANFADVSILDDTSPSIVDGSCSISGDELTFTVSDTQSGIDYNSVYGIYDDGTVVQPVSVDRESGTIVIPMTSEGIDLYYSDMAGNSLSSHITAELKVINKIDAIDEAAEGSAEDVVVDPAAEELPEQ